MSSDEQTPQTEEAVSQIYKSAGSFGALQSRDFRIYITGQGIAVVGMTLQAITASWLAYRISGSSMALGWMGFAAQFPVFLLSLFGGVLADRYSKRTLIFCTQSVFMLTAVASAILVFTGWIQIWQMLLMSVIAGIASSLDMPSRHALIAEIVDRKDLANGIALNTSVFNVGRLAGPMIAGMLLPLIGEGWCFSLTSLGYLAVLAALLAMRVRHVPRPSDGVSALPQIAEGIRYARSDNLIKAILLFMIMIGLIAPLSVTLMPVFALKVLGGDATTMGILSSANGLGACLGGLFMVFFSNSLRYMRCVIFANLGCAAGLVVFGLSTNLWVSCGALVFSGFCGLVQFTACNTTLQLHAPEHVRGRVLSLFFTLSIGVMPFGALLAGWSAETFGAGLTAVGAGIAMLVASVGFIALLMSMDKKKPFAR